MSKETELQEDLIDFMLKGLAEGAIPIGTTIEKVVEEPGDMTKIGTRGIVKGNIKNTTEDNPVKYAYLINWENTPEDTLVFVIDYKIKEIT